MVFCVDRQGIEIEDVFQRLPGLLQLRQYMRERGSKPKLIQQAQLYGGKLLRMKYFRNECFRNGAISYTGFIKLSSAPLEEMLWVTLLETFGGNVRLQNTHQRQDSFLIFFEDLQGRRGFSSTAQNLLDGY